MVPLDLCRWMVLPTTSLGIDGSRIIHTMNLESGRGKQKKSENHPISHGSMIHLSSRRSNNPHQTKNQLTKSICGGDSGVPSIDAMQRRSPRRGQRSNEPTKITAALPPRHATPRQVQSHKSRDTARGS
jgi:hypothetical protein